MPEKKETFTIVGYDTETLMVLSFGAFKQLDWDAAYAGNNSITGFTINSWKKRGEQINVTTTESEVTVQSKFIHGQSFDLGGRNKKHLREFMAAFETTRQNATEEQKAEWAANLAVIKEATIKTTEDEAKQREEIDKVMNFSSGSRLITYTIIAINFLVFIAMIATGADFFQPTGIDIIKWGANYAPLTLSGDWWRLLTCVFVHIGIVHILFNMYALFYIGMYLEPMLGKARYVTAYLCTGVFASIASLWWHTQPVPSAGASGAIFGMYGVFLALLTTNIIPRQIRKQLLQSIGIFVGYNLLYGLKSGVDNAAHTGGLVSGLLIGYIFYFSLTKKTETKINTLLMGCIIALTIAASLFYIQTKKLSAGERESISKVIENSKFKESEKFEEKYNDIINIQERAMAPLRDTILSDEQRAKELMEKSLPEWNDAERLAEQMNSLTDISPSQKKKRETILEYINGRKNEIKIINRVVNESNTQNGIDLTRQRETLDSLVTVLNSQ